MVPDARNQFPPDGKPDILISSTMRKRTDFILIAMALALSVATFSCRKEDYILDGEETVINPWDSISGDITGFYLLNEGNMGSNKASLDYYDYSDGTYYRNIYGERNPNEVKALGDVGNDLKIYGGKLWAVINCSNYVEIMDVSTAEHIGKIAVPNCRYLAFKDGYAYVSAYAGPVEIDSDARIGFIAKIDTASLRIVDSCIVGYQPEEMAVIGNKLYVANSGGYRAPDYDSTVSVIDLGSFEEMYKIDVGINLDKIEPDNYGNLYVSSRGDHYTVPSRTFIIDTRTDKVTDTLDLLPNSTMTLAGDSLYVLSSEYNYITGRHEISYAIWNTATKSIVTRSFIKDGTEKKIQVPYGIAVNRCSGEFFVTDAKDYISPGILHCFSPDGRLKWSITTGDIPAHIVFTTKPFKK